MPMVSDRDNVTEITMAQKEGGSFIASQSVSHPAAPPVKGCVRMFNHDLTLIK